MKIRLLLINGDVFITLADKFGKLLNIKYNGSLFIQNQYDADDRLISATDYISGKVTSFTYDKNGNTLKTVDGDIIMTSDMDNSGNIEKIKYSIAGLDITHEYGYNYDDKGQLKAISYPNNGKTETVEYDTFSRIVEIDKPTEKKQIHYYQKGDHATNLVSSVRQGNDRTGYRYDKKGNITEIHENGKLISRYAYDALSRLVREDNVKLNKSITIEYDNNGNILNKVTYPFSLDSLVYGSEKIYGYSANGNRDRLTSYDNKFFEYDSLGNPTV